MAKGSHGTTGLRSGQVNPCSGQYEIIGPRRGHTSNERSVTRGQPMPPPSKAESPYSLVDPTKHK